VGIPALLVCLSETRVQESGKHLTVIVAVLPCCHSDTMAVADNKPVGRVCGSDELETGDFAEHDRPAEQEYRETQVASLVLPAEESDKGVFCVRRVRLPSYIPVRV
jgi:hypothetical protein